MTTQVLSLDVFFFVDKDPHLNVVERQGNFNYGRMHVALSRVTSLNSLYLIGKFNLAAIRAEPRAINEYQQM